MSKRFQIEDIVAQGKGRVVFRATDTATGQAVAVRRFFPRGPEHGSLGTTERAVFEAVVERASGVSHPALRAVVGGGCDPVDGVPFLVTEWVDGQPIGEILAHGPLQAGQVMHVLGAALDVCQWLSERFGQEGVWVETRLSSVIVGSPESGRGVTFRVSMTRWVSGGDPRRGYSTLVRMGQELLGIRGRAIADRAGDGLGQWLNWLRGGTGEIPIAVARANLQSVASTGRLLPEPPLNVTGGAAAAADPDKVPVTRVAGTGDKQASARFPWWIAGAAATVVALAGWWFWPQRGQAAAGERAGAADGRAGRAVPQVVPASDSEAARVAATNLRAAALSESIRQAGDVPASESPVVPPAVPDSKIAPMRMEGDAPVYVPEQVAAMMQLRNRKVIVVGELATIDASRDGKRLHLYFTLPGQTPVTFGILYVDPAQQRSVLERLNPWIGKRIRIAGQVDIDHTNRIHRPKIIMRDEQSVKLAEP